jgi:hypothetical protein
MTIREENKADFPEIVALRDRSSLTPLAVNCQATIIQSLRDTGVGTQPIRTRAATPPRRYAQTPTRRNVPFSVNIHPTCGMKISARELSF